MGINFAESLGRNINSGRLTNKAQDDRPKAQYWLNIGYVTTVNTESGGTEDRFVSLPTGIPLDTQDLLKTNSQNELFAAFQAARNNLLEQVIDVCKGLEPGEEKIIGMAEGGLSIQLRRVNDEKAEVKPANNMFVKKLSFAA